MQSQDYEKAKRIAYDNAVQQLMLYKEMIAQSREQFKAMMTEGTTHVYCSQAQYLDVLMIVCAIDAEIEVVAHPDIELGKVYFT